MSKKLLLAPFMLLLFCLTACEETKEISKYDNWQERNDQFIDSLYNVYTTQPDRGGLDSIHLLSAPSKFIFYKKLDPVTDLPDYKFDEDELPLDQSTAVLMYYKGTNILKERFDGFMGDEPTLFDKPVKFNVNYGSVIIGWWEILQRMPLGARWEVYIPWEFGYGARGTDGILGYSSLIFDMQLYDIINLVTPTALELDEEEESILDAE